MKKLIWILLFVSIGYGTVVVPPGTIYYVPITFNHLKTPNSGLQVVPFNLGRINDTLFWNNATTGSNIAICDSNGNLFKKYIGENYSAISKIGNGVALLPLSATNDTTFFICAGSGINNNSSDSSLFANDSIKLYTPMQNTSTTIIDWAKIASNGTGSNILGYQKNGVFGSTEADSVGTTTSIFFNGLSSMQSATHLSLIGIYSQNTVNVGAFMYVRRKNGTGAYDFALQPSTDSNIYIYTRNNDASYGYFNYMRSGGATNKNLFHISIIYDGTQSTNATKLVCYLNGVQKTLSFSGTIPASLPNSTNWAGDTLFYCNDLGGGHVGLAGKIDNFMLTTNTISGNYATTNYNLFFDTTTITYSTAIKASANVGYSKNPAIDTIGKTFTNTCSYTPITADSFSISPSLPSGLIFNKTTGNISGITLISTGAITYTVTAYSNTLGNTTCQLVLTSYTNPTNIDSIHVTTEYNAYTVVIPIDNDSVWSFFCSGPSHCEKNDSIVGVKIYNLSKTISRRYTIIKDAGGIDQLGALRIGDSIYIFYQVEHSTGGGYCDVKGDSIMVIHSTNMACTTFSAPTKISAVFDASTSTFPDVRGQKIGDGSYIQPFYRLSTSTPYTFVNGYWRSTDTGKTWSSVVYDSSITDSACESSILYLGNNKLLALARNLSAQPYDPRRVFQYTSDNNGSTWTSAIHTNIGIGTVPEPELIRDTIRDWVIASYMDRKDSTYKVAYNYTNVAFNNPTKWHIKNVAKMGSVHVGYGSSWFYNGNFNVVYGEEKSTLAQAPCDQIIRWNIVLDSLPVFTYANAICTTSILKTIVPIITHGTIDSFHVITTLPSGLTLNKVTGIITGTATTDVSKDAYTIRSYWSGDSSDAVCSLTVSSIAPVITTQPRAIRVSPGRTATFNVVVYGSEPFTYQWQKDSVDIGSATNASYTTPQTDSTYNGKKFRCIVTNIAGIDTSNNAILTVKKTGGFFFFWNR